MKQTISKVLRLVKFIANKIKDLIPKIFSEKFFIDCVQTMLKTSIIAVITAIFLFIGNSIFKDYQEVEYSNKIIDCLCLGESKEYIESILGIPRFEFFDEMLSNSFYALDKIVIRCTFDNELLVGYFVTAKVADSKIKMNGPLTNGDMIKFGTTTFEPDEYPDAAIDGCVGMGGSAAISTYYWEYNYMYGVGLYRSYVTAIFPYGFTEKDSYSLMAIANVESIKSEEVNNYRATLHPNTFGIMDSHYQEIIKPYMYTTENDTLWMECMMTLIQDVQ